MREQLKKAYDSTIINTKYPDRIYISFLNGPRASIYGQSNKKYKVDFVDLEKNNKIYSTVIKSGQWAEALPKWVMPWQINVYDQNELIYSHDHNLRQKNVVVVFGSKSIGDTLAWVPYVDIFQKRYGAEVFCATWHNDWFKGQYKNINFISHEDVKTIPDIYAQFAIGWFYNEKSTDVDYTHSHSDCRTVSLQELAAQVLRVPSKEIKPRTIWGNSVRPLTDKYICIGPHSTAGCKHWPVEYWQTVVDHCIKEGYKVIYLAPPNMHKSKLLKLSNVTVMLGQPLTEVARYLQHAELLIGLGSGLSWIAWAMNTHVIMIAGFSGKFFEFQEGISRPYPEVSDACTGCFNDPMHLFDRHNWNWCPRQENTKRQFECQKLITPKMVIKHITKQTNE